MGSKYLTPELPFDSSGNLKNMVFGILFAMLGIIVKILILCHKVETEIISE